MSTETPNGAHDSEDLEKNEYERAIEDDASPRIEPTDEARSISAFVFGPVKRVHADLALLACCFVTGMVDAASFANWSVFVGMQTGKEFHLPLFVLTKPR